MHFLNAHFHCFLPGPRKNVSNWAPQALRLALYSCASMQYVYAHQQNGPNCSFVMWYTYVLSFCCIYVNYSWNVCGRNLKFYTHVHLCTFFMYISNRNKFQMFIWPPYLFSCYNYVNNPWNICDFICMCIDIHALNNKPIFKLSWYIQLSLSLTLLYNCHSCMLTC